MITTTPSSTAAHLPSAEAVSNILTGLLGKPVTVKRGGPIALDPHTAITVAVYGYDDGSPVVVCVCDLALASGAGAALSLVPAGIAAEALRSGKLPEVILDNLREVFNVCSSLFGRGGGRHVGLRAVYPDWQSIPGLVVALLGHSAARLDLDVTIPAYGSGRLSLFAA